MPDSTLIVDGYGSRRVHIVYLTHGMKVIADEVGGRNHRAFHPKLRTSGSFSLVIKHPTEPAWRDFNEWMKVYAERLSSSENGLPPMRVVVPAVRFDRMGIPARGIEFGDTVGALAYTSRLDFKGTSDLVNLDAADLGEISQAFLPTYYEAGGQSGDYISNYGVATLHDAIVGGKDFEDLLYAPKVPSIPSPSTLDNPRKDFYEGLTRHLRETGGA